METVAERETAKIRLRIVVCREEFMVRVGGLTCRSFNLCSEIISHTFTGKAESSLSLASQGGSDLGWELVLTKVGSRILPVKTTTMTLTRKRQTVFPLEWCRRVGLEHGGPLNVFDLGEQGLLIRPLKPLTKAEMARLLAQPPAGSHSAKEAAAIVGSALRKVRRG